MTRSLRARTPPNAAWVEDEEQDPSIVTREDLERIPLLHDIIGALDDRRASARDIARVIQRLPSLAARISNAWQRHFPTGAPPSLVVQIAMLGHREIEGVLLTLLEDLTILRAELMAEDEEGARSARGPSSKA